MTYAEKFNPSSTCANSEGVKRSITVSTRRHRVCVRVPRGQTNSAGHFVSYAGKQTVFRERLIFGDPGYVRTPRATGNSADLLL